MVIYTPKIIIFCFALYNFASIWFSVKLSEGIACIACPWYKPLTFYNEPSLLFYAAIFLLLNRRQSNLLAVGLSGFVFGKGIYLISRFGWLNWLKWLPQQWEYIRRDDLDVLKEWEAQIVFALIVFGFSIYYFIQEKSCKKSFLH